MNRKMAIVSMLLLATGAFAADQTLAITARGGKIKLGAGATLTFADSSAETWPKTAMVKVEGFAEKAIRFGTSHASAPSRKIFTTDEGRLYVDDEGYLTASLPGGLIIVR